MLPKTQQLHLIRVPKLPTMLESDISKLYPTQRRSYLREASMPDSPTDPAAHPPQGPPVSSPNTNPSSVPVVADVRSLNNSTSPAVNGAHTSPTGPVSPSSIGNSVTQLPPACGARQLSKLKRFLTTLQQFGSDISPEIGERVRGLVMNLVNSTISIEEFHAQLQEATNFPLRPFVIPFLKANLPLLQRELLQCAQMAKQTPPQYLRQHEDILSERETAPLDPEELNPLEINENGKRKAPSENMRPKENGGPPDLAMQMMAELGKPIPKRPFLGNSSSFNKPSQLRMEDITIPQGSSRDGDPTLPDALLDSKHEVVDDWKHVDTMLQCIIGMVDKTKRAVAVLQQRCTQDREELLAWARKTAEETEAEVKRRAGELMAKTLKQTEERVAEVKRRAEEAVSDVKRQAVVELQKAVRAAEEKANEAVASAHGKMEKAVLEARRQATEDTLAMSNHQSDSSESCWNCGRKATETCSGCNVARYCGPFCQHKDWENHHHVCGQQAQAASEDNPQGGGPQSVGSPKDTNTSSPAVTRMTTPTSSSDPISSLSDYVMKTPST
ncbi:protein CBFA2T3-like isoform X2 [Stylophora pistillata]|uniref:protein CBFA2T3-like isoform X2 n=1 Tax=Stylophora pistillata TaxID=50429 RepID=UPI000C0521B4|nr:protein CBFA2T3-like isoform X2 [Stylophora pistillata]